MYGYGLRRHPVNRHISKLPLTGRVACASSLFLTSPTYINQSEYTEAASGIALISVLYLVQNANWRSFHESQSF